jgi:hypothetical protein
MADCGSRRRDVGGVGEVGAEAVLLLDMPFELAVLVAASEA